MSETTMLFIGDSLTACGRDRTRPDDLGNGWVRLVAHALQNDGPVKVINRGIGGDRVRDLAERWHRDCLDLAPDVLTVQIGINDTWRRYDSDDPVTVGRFTADLREILDRARAGTGARLILAEPYLLPMGGVLASWREDLDPKIEVIRALAKEFDAALVGLDQAMSDAAARSGAATWTTDGIHTTAAGNALVASEWLAVQERLS
ncbi:SGNH/GDSL hydrolase family protein [Streptosporangium sp. KLBMP 9127]|nr:SGNH/GDSL hydrolase family protein [Streptosporangium sp. KLBMP 9127]